MRPSIWFWVVGVLALLFNSFGAYDYTMTQTVGAEYLSAQGFTPDQIAYWESMPAWRTALWALGVFSGILAAVLFLMRKAFSVLLFGIGPVVFAIDLIAGTLGGAASVMGASYFIASAVILIFLVLIWLYARRQKQTGVLS